MLLQMDGSCPSTGSRSSGIPGLLNSPTLARVERAMLRHDEEGSVGSSGRDSNLLHRATYTQSLLAPSYSGKDSSFSAIKRGLLWQQRDKFFSRWKERYFILTKDYLHCFRRASGPDRISEMGQFLFKVKLVDVDRVLWENKKTYSTVALVMLGRDGKVYLRAPEGLEDWFELLEECTFTSKERRRITRTSTQQHNGGVFYKDNNNDMNSLEDWIAERQKIPLGRLQHHINFTSAREEVKRRQWPASRDDYVNSSLDNRLSLLTDIDINSYDDDTLTTPSVTSYRMNNDVLCIQPPSLRDSYRSHNRDHQEKLSLHQDTSQHIKYRERSYSDIQHVDKRQWKPRYNYD